MVVGTWHCRDLGATPAHRRKRGDSMAITSWQAHWLPYLGVHVSFQHHLAQGFHHFHHQQACRNQAQTHCNR